MSKPMVGYYRVSTRKQGRSGLGIDAQRGAVARFAEAEGFEIVAEHIEIETGKGADALERRRPRRGPRVRAAVCRPESGRTTLTRSWPRSWRSGLCGILSAPASSS